MLLPLRNFTLKILKNGFTFVGRVCAIVLKGLKLEILLFCVLLDTKCVCGSNNAYDLRNTTYLKNAKSFFNDFVSLL